MEIIHNTAFTHNIIAAVPNIIYYISSVVYPMGRLRQLYWLAIISPYAPAERKASKSPRLVAFIL